MYAIILIFGLNPTELVVRDSFDMVELNYVYAADGREIFSQIIFWNYLPEVGGFVVDEWMFAKSKLWAERRGNQWVVYLVEGPRLRRITARYVQTSWTYYDRERANHLEFHPSGRIGLSFSGEDSVRRLMEKRPLPSLDRN